MYFISERVFPFKRVSDQCVIWCIGIHKINDTVMERTKLKNILIPSDVQRRPNDGPTFWV